MSGVIARADPLWDTTYPKGLQPRPGESLAGFFLRLDEVNHLDAGATLRAVRPHGGGPAATTKPGYFLSARTFNLTMLAQLAGALPIADVERLTAIPVLRWLYANGSGSNLVTSASCLRVCPACLSERAIPLVTLFRGVDACPQHGHRLLDRCTCGDQIVLFPGAGYPPFVCPQPACRHAYWDLPAEALDHAELARSNRLAAAYADLAAAADGRDPLPQRELGARLSAALLAAGISRDQDPKLFQRIVHPSTATIADVLARTSRRAEDVLGRPADPAQRVRGQSSASLSLGRACPNPACPGGAKIYDNGHHTALNNKQERLCLACGTRWTQERVLFSFDRVAGYSAVKAAANAGRLIDLRGQVDAACADAFRAGRRIVRARIFKAADVPDALVYLSRRAGLAELVELWCDVQRAA